jgi:hypothetical protein
MRLAQRVTGFFLGFFLGLRVDLDLGRLLTGLGDFIDRVVAVRAFLSPG